MTRQLLNDNDYLDVSGLAAVSLLELLAVADLQRRHDAKYVVARWQLAGLVASMGERMRVLEVDGCRSTPYVSTYFDTPKLRCYRDHLMSRRRRFKVRTRHYGDPAAAMLELKLKNGRGQTVKHRWPHPSAPDHLGPAALALLGPALRDAYGVALPEGLALRVETRFRRTTLVDLDAGERITVDQDLTVLADGKQIVLGAEHAVVEIKAAALRGTGTRAMAELGLRPNRISKYCVAVASCYEDVRGNPWLPVLRRMTAGASASGRLSRPSGSLDGPTG